VADGDKRLLQEKQNSGATGHAVLYSGKILPTPLAAIQTEFNRPKEIVLKWRKANPKWGESGTETQASNLLTHNVLSGENDKPLQASA